MLPQLIMYQAILSVPCCCHPHSLAHTKGTRAKKELHCRRRLRLLQMSKMLQHQQKAVETQARASKAGGKVTAEPPRLARNVKPAVHREATWRYRVPEAKGGWIARPQIEPHGGWDQGCSMLAFVSRMAHTPVMYDAL